jgi:hypothetical protein
MHPLGEPGRRRVAETYPAEELGPYTDFEWGMLNGKLSALRWVLGDEWDFLAHLTAARQGRSRRQPAPRRTSAVPSRHAMARQVRRPTHIESSPTTTSHRPC